jgi:hypothetical protein
MSGRTSSNDDMIRHQQERDHAESEVDRARGSTVGTKGLSGLFQPDEKSDTEEALERATEERGVKPDRGERSQ